MGLYVGMDLHSNNCYTGIIDEEEKQQFSRKLPNDKAKIISALAPYRDEIIGVAVESTYNGYWLVDALMEKEYKVHLANPAAMKQYEGIKYLDDKQDAFWLARMLKLGILPEGYIYPRESRGTRDLLRQRSRFVIQKTSLKHTLQQVVCNQTGVTLSNNALNEIDDEKLAHFLKDEDVSFSAKSMLETIRFLEGRIKAIETRIVGQIKGDPIYPVLTSVPGIGRVLGITIALETGPIERFSSAGDFASYARCVPSSYWSNAKQKGSGNVKNGNRYLSWAFAEAAHFAIRYCKGAKGFYQRKCAKTNQPSAYRAMANKLAKACYFMMKEKKEFDVKRLFV